MFVDSGAWWGGDSHSMTTLTRELVAMKLRVDVIVDYPMPHHERYRQAGVNVVERFPKRPAWFPQGWRPRKGADADARIVLPNWLRQPKGLDRASKIISAKRLASILRERAPDIVHFNNLKSRSIWDVKAARNQGRCRLVGHVRNLSHAEPIARAVASRCDRLIAISDYVERELRRSHRELTNSVVRVYNPVGEYGIVFPGSQVEARRLLELPTDRLILGCPAILDPRKGQRVVLEALMLATRVDPTTMLVLAGEELVYAKEYADALRTLSNDPRLRGRVRFLGHCSDMAAFYAASDIVLAVAVDGEAFGRVAVEAALARKPVIASRAGATPELVIDCETGFLVEPGNVEHLAHTLDEVVPDSAKLRDVSAKAAERASRLFSPKRIAQAMLEVYADSRSRSTDGLRVQA